MSETAMKLDTCVTATLLRGRVYAFKNVIYSRDVPKIVEDENLAYELEDLYDEVTDSDGELIEKSIFAIDFEASFPKPPHETRRSRKKGHKRVTRQSEGVKSKTKVRKARGSLAR